MAASRPANQIILLRSTVDPTSSGHDSGFGPSPPPSNSDSSGDGQLVPPLKTPTEQKLPYVWELKRQHTLGRGSYGTASVVEVLSPLPPWFPEDVLRASPHVANPPGPGGKSRLQLVIKEINLSCCPRNDCEALFREVDILKAVRHPNVVRYIDSCIDAETNHLLILMEYCDGGDLSQFMDATNRRSPTKGLTEQEVWALLIQLLMALKCLHFDHRIIHRDLKPQNIFLTTTGVVKLGDFGVSTVLAQSESFAQQFCGSPYYLAPEIIEEKPYNGKADLWALGCVMYEVMASERAFKGDQLNLLLQDIVEGNFAPIDTVVCCLQADEIQRPDAERTGFRPELRRITGLLLRRDPDQRASIVRLLRLPAIHSRGPRLLHPELMKTKPYIEQFRPARIRLSGQGTPLAFGGPGNWTDLVSSAQASPTFRAVGPRPTSRGLATPAVTPSMVGSRVLPTPMNRPAGASRLKIVQANKSRGTGTLTSPLSGAPAQLSPGQPPLTSQPTTIFFPKESPMIPCYGVEASAAPSPAAGGDRGLPGGVASPAAYNFDRMPLRMAPRTSDTCSEDTDDANTPLAVAHKRHDPPMCPNSDSDDPFYAATDDAVAAGPTADETVKEEEIYGDWRVPGLCRGTIHFTEDDIATHSAASPVSHLRPSGPTRCFSERDP